MSGRCLLVVVLADAVDDLVKLASNDRVFRYPAGKHVGGGVEEAPGGAVAPVEGGIFPLAQNIRMRCTFRIPARYIVMMAWSARSSVRAAVL